MKKIITITLSLFVTTLVFGQKNKKFYDSLGNETTFELHWSQVVGGRYKSVYDKNTNSKTLARTTDKEFKEALSKTEKRITDKERNGTNLPDFEMSDIDGNTVSNNRIKGKVAVINFWFVGCSPCEMERPELNGLATLYHDNENVMFISFAGTEEAKLRAFLTDHPFLFKPIPMPQDEIKAKFGLEGFPVTVVVDKEGKYSFYGIGTGIGISYILKREIELALNK